MGDPPFEWAGSKGSSHPLGLLPQTVWAEALPSSSLTVLGASCCQGTEVGRSLCVDDAL